MTDRHLCNVLAIVLWCVALCTWVGFVLLFREDGPLSKAPIESKALWFAVAFGLTVAVNWASRPDRQSH